MTQRTCGFIGLLVLVALTAGVAGAQPFSSDANYPVSGGQLGSHPISIVTAPLHGSALDDVAVADYGSGKVTVLYNNGSGAFPTVASYPVGANPHAIAAGHLHGPTASVIDLAVADASGSVAILLNNGSGVFTPQPLINLPGTQPFALAIGDFNGDGANDIALCAGPSLLIILLGNKTAGIPNGTFTLHSQTTLSGRALTSIAVGTFSPRITPHPADLAIADETGHVITLAGDGAGGFGAPVVVTNKVLRPYALIARDGTGGVADIVVTDYDGFVYVIIGTSPGNFAAATPYMVGEIPNSVAGGDFNADGKLDLVVTNSFDGTIGFLQGLGGGAFLNQTTIDAQGSLPSSVAAGHFKSAGETDIAVANYNANNQVGTVSIFFGTP